MQGVFGGFATLNICTFVVLGEENHRQCLCAADLCKLVWLCSRSGCALYLELRHMGCCAVHFAVVLQRCMLLAVGGWRLVDGFQHGLLPTQVRLCYLWICTSCVRAVVAGAAFDVVSKSRVE